MTEPFQILVNQVGYDSGKEKRFVVQAGAEEIPTYFEVTDLKGKTFYRGSLERAGEINYWENNYWVGDFTDLEAEGRFIVRIGDISKTICSHPFMIARDLVFEETGELAQTFFHYQRCGTEVEGWHGACHMDDGRMPDGSRLDVSGGWHDAGDYNKYNGFTPLSVFALIYAYEKRSAYYNRYVNADGVPTIINEALWGARWLLKMQPEPGILLDRVFSGYSYWGLPEGETDNVPGNDDDRPIEGIAGVWASALTSAALTKLSAWVEEEVYLDAAKALWGKAIKKKPSLESDASLLLADEALHQKTGKDLYLKDSSKRIENLLAAQQDEGWFASSDGSPYSSITQLGFPAACMADFALNQPEPDPDAVGAVSRYLDFSIRTADNPFELSTLYSANGSTSFFYRYPDNDSWYVGQNSQYLSQSWAGLLGFALTREKRFRRYAMAQINWVLGTNPFGVCMFEGKGSVNPGVYHHRYDSIPGRERGAVPGCVPNGIVRLSVERDAPRFDLKTSGRGDYQSNEPWLPHNAFYLLAASSL